MKWSSVGEFDIDDSDGGESENDFPHPIPKRVRPKVYFSKGFLMLWFKFSRAGLATIRRSKEPQIVPIRILLIRLMTHNLAKFGSLMHSLPSGFSLLNS